MIDDFPGLQEKQTQTCSCLVGRLRKLLRPVVMKNIFNKNLFMLVGWLSVIRVNKTFNPWLLQKRHCLDSSMRDKVGTLGNTDEQSAFGHRERHTTIIRAAAGCSGTYVWHICHSLLMCLPRAGLSPRTNTMRPGPQRGPPSPLSFPRPADPHRTQGNSCCNSC